MTGGWIGCVVADAAEAVRIVSKWGEREEVGRGGGGGRWEVAGLPDPLKVTERA